LLAALSDKMVVKSIFINLMDDLTNMKVDQSVMLSPQLVREMANLGHLLARLRQARKVKQADAALRAGFSRNTAYRLEKGDPGLAIGQVLRYLDAIAPGATLADLLTQADPALTALQARESTKRVRDLTAAELAELNF
jgi:transcriptional regulator with XRE-family HTH domain